MASSRTLLCARSAPTSSGSSPSQASQAGPVSLLPLGSPWMFCLGTGLCTRIVLGLLPQEEDEREAEEEYAAGLMDIPAMEISPPPPSLGAGVDGTQGCGST